MRSIALLFSVLMNSMPALSQTSEIDLSGTYYLQGVMETASVIQLNPDSSFDFFYSYGALDRSGHGKWSLQNNKVLLNSTTLYGKPFRLISMEERKTTGFTIKIKLANQVILPYFAAFFKMGKDTVFIESDKEGLIQSELIKPEAIGLIFTLCMEEPVWFIEFKPGSNYLVFEPENWICDIFFKNLELTPGTGKLVGPHPLLPKRNYNYVKE